MSSPLRDWTDILLKGFIAAATAYGSWYLASTKQTSDKILAQQGQQLNIAKQTYDELHSRQMQQNDDVRLLVEMVDGDEVHRVMGLALAKAYASSDPPRIPITVFEDINNWIHNTSSLSQIEQANSVASEVKGSPQVVQALQAAAKSLPVRVYIQFQRGPATEGANAGRLKAEAIRQALDHQTAEGKTIIVPPVEGRNEEIAQPLLKCFRKTECREMGSTLVAKLKEVGAPENFKCKYVPGYEDSTTIRAYHFEAWFGPLVSTGGQIKVAPGPAGPPVSSPSAPPCE